MTLLKDIVQIEKGRKYNLLEENQEGAIRVFQANDFRNENKPLYTFDNDGVLAQEDDIMLVWDGSVGQMGFGRCGYVGSTMVKLKVKNKKQFSPFFIYRFLQTKSEYLKRKATGATIMHINRKSLEQLEIPDLELPDQLHIANLLSKAENLIAQRKESIRLLDEFLKSTFLEMFGNNTSDDKGWRKISLIEGCVNKKDVKCGPFGTQLSKSEYQENGIPVWGIPQINSEFKILPKEFVTKDKALELDEYSVIPYDIVMSRKGNVGKCSLFPNGFSKGIIHSDVLRIRTDFKKVHPVFLLFQLKHSKKIEIQIKGVTKGAIMAGINVGLLKHIIIDQPPIELQSQFAQIVEKTEALKSQYQQSLNELENLYGNLSQRAFRGELSINKAVSI
jgi:type I restriction enzyme S subunit